MTIENNLGELVSAKNDIKQALIEKNSAPTGGLVTYADAIRNIEGGTEIDCDMVFPNDVVAVKVKVGDEDVSETVITDGHMQIEKPSSDVHIRVTEIKSITYILGNVTSSNMADRVPKEWDYSTVLTCDYGYEFDNVIVMMGGVDVTETVLSRNGKNDVADIVINGVTGDITISVACKLKTYSITNELSHSQNSNLSESITHGQAYTAKVTADEHYALTGVLVKMGDDILVNEEYDELDGHYEYDITIPQAINDITITCETKQIVRVTNVLTDVTSDNSVTLYRYGDTYNETLTTSQYYDFSFVTSNIVSTSISDTVLNESDRTRSKTVSIASLTEDVTITALAERVSYSIQNILTDTTTNNENTAIFEGENYSSILTPSQYFEFKEYTITMGGVDITDRFNTSNGEITINEVIGDIVIDVVSTNIVCTVTNILSNGVDTNNNATTVLMGQSYYELLNVNYGEFDEVNVTVTMGDETLSYNNMENGEIDIPLVLGDIVVTANAVNETLSQYNTLEHYTTKDIQKLQSGESVEVILTAPKIDHGYTFGYDGDKEESHGNGYKNLVRMQHEVAPLSTDDKYKMVLYKKQDTKMEDVYGQVVKTFTVSGSLYNSNVTKLNSTISGYDLYGLSTALSVGGSTTRTGTVTISFSGKSNPNTNIYAKMYASNTGGTTDITVNGQTIRATTSTSTVNLNDFTEINMRSMSITFNLSANNNGWFGSRNYNVYFLVPNNLTETDVVGQQEVPDGLPYFTLTTKLGGKSITDTDNLRSMPDGFNVLEIEDITSQNTTQGLLTHNNPCVFKFVRIEDGKLLSSGNAIGELGYDDSESDKTVWYLYKPNTAGYSTTNVTVSYNLVHAETSNSANSVEYGSPYSTLLSWEESRTPYRLTVKMGGHDITQSALNADSRAVNIPSVIAPVAITVACVDAEDMSKVTYSLYDVAGVTDKEGYSESMSTDTYDAVLIGDEYSAKPTFEGLTTLSDRNFNMTIEPSQYKFMKVTECYADMGGVRYENIYDEDTNTITIPEITGDCNITIKALYIVGYVDDTYYDVDMSDNHIFVEADALGAGNYSLKYTNIGEEITNSYDNIATFNI